MIHLNGQSIHWLDRTGCLSVEDVPKKYFYRHMAPFPPEINVQSEQTGNWLKFKLEFPNNQPVYVNRREGMKAISFFIATKPEYDGWVAECKRRERIVDGF